MVSTHASKRECIINSVNPISNDVPPRMVQRVPPRPVSHREIVTGPARYAMTSGFALGPLYTGSPALVLRAESARSVRNSDEGDVAFFSLFRGVLGVLMTYTLDELNDMTLLNQASSDRVQ